MQDGNTVCYVRLEDSELYYTISAAAAPEAVILNPGDRVEISFVPAEDELLVTASSLEITRRA